MARDESDRENLLREATALVERIELVPCAPLSCATGSASAVGEPAAENIVIGFRTVDAASFFLGADPVYQFNTAGELRRAYCDGLLYKAVRGRLVSLRRVRQQNEVPLLRHELTDDQQAAFVARMRDRLRELATNLDAGRYQVAGQVPADADVLGCVRAWLARHDGTPVAARPNVLRPSSERCG